MKVVAMVAVLAGIVAGSAYALAFDDADYFWPNGEVGTPYNKQILGRTDVGVPGSDGHTLTARDCTCTFPIGKL